MINVAVIMAAGNSARFDDTIPKQYMKVAGESILRRVVTKFINHELIDAVIVVIGADHVELYQQEIGGLEVLPYAIGGERRQDSVRNALDALSQYSPKNVLIHDAARIFIEDSVITDTINALDVYEGASAAAKLVDTLKYSKDHVIERTVARDNLFLAQTPQGFRYDIIHALHREHKAMDFTDDAGLFEHAGKQVKIVSSPLRNFKITTSEDLMLAHNILEKVH